MKQTWVNFFTRLGTLTGMSFYTFTLVIIIGLGLIHFTSSIKMNCVKKNADISCDIQEYAKHPMKTEFKIRTDIDSKYRPGAELYTVKVKRWYDIRERTESQVIFVDNIGNRFNFTSYTRRGDACLFSNIFGSGCGKLITRFNEFITNKDKIFTAKESAVWDNLLGGLLMIALIYIFKTK